MPFSQYNNGGSSSKWRRPSSSFSNSVKQEQDPYSTDALERQIENAKVRIADSGYDADKDERNWFERMTNLPAGQNGFFDVLELLGRPGQGVMNAVKQQNFDPLKGLPTTPVEGFNRAIDFLKDKTPHADLQTTTNQFLDGLSGRETTRGSELAEQLYGIQSKPGKFAAGLGLEIGLDPLNLIPAGAIANTTKAAAKGAKTAYNGLEELVPALRSARDSVTPAASAVKDGLGKIFVPQYKWDETLDGAKDDTLKRLYNQTDNDIKFQTEEALRNVADVAKTTGIKAGDDVGRLMEKDLIQHREAPAYKLPDGRITEEYGDIIRYDRDMRKGINYQGQQLNKQARDYKQAEAALVEALDQTNKGIDKLYFGIERPAMNAVKQERKANLRDASDTIREIDRNLGDLARAEKSLFRWQEKQVRESHKLNFGILDELKRVAPNGIKGLARAEMPSATWSLIRSNGKAIDEVANELGYRYADDLIQELKNLNGIPKKLDPSTVSRLATNEAERSGALKQIQAEKSALLESRNFLVKSIDEAAREAKSPQFIASQQETASGRAFDELFTRPEYQTLDNQKKVLTQQLDDLRNEATAAKAQGIEGIRRLQDILSQTKESRNPITIQKINERPVREMSSDPTIQAAASNLMKSNNELREWAQANGVDVKELEGYMTHVLSAEERALRKTNKPISVDRGNNGPGQPNKKILNSRELLGSVEDINEQVGRKFFEPNAFFATAIGQKRLIEFGNAVKFRREVLGNPDFAVPYEKGMILPDNAVVINTNSYSFMKDPSRSLPDEIGGDYVVTNGVKEALDRYQRLTTDQGMNAFKKTVDSATTAWKKLALFSPAYHLRNQVGGMFNNWVGGMNEFDLAKYTGESIRDVVSAIKGKESDLYREYRQQGLGSTNLSKVEFRNGNEPEKEITKLIEERSKGPLQQVMMRLNPLRAFETSRELGDVVDQTNRFALYKWAREKKGLSPDKAAAKVREVQFDYTRTTNVEREVLARVIPFYRWMRNNIPYQIMQLIHDPRKYSNFNKVRLNAQESAGIDEENIPEYMKQSFAIPVAGDGEGSGKFLSLNLPVGDLTKITSLGGMGKTLVDSSHPIPKLIAELSMNRNFFYDKPIEKFEGQEKQYRIPGTDVEFGVGARSAYTAEQLLGQIGRGMSQYLQKPEEEDLDTKFRVPALGISSVVKDFDVEQSRFYQLLDELNRLRQKMDYIEQQTGERPRTIQEIRR